MAKSPAFVLIYDRAIVDHLAAIDSKHHALIRSVIEEQLSFEPTTPSRNRKRLDRPFAFGASWELRFGPDNRFRVFYRINDEDRVVRVLAIGVKERNRLWIGGEEVQL